MCLPAPLPGHHVRGTRHDRCVPRWASLMPGLLWAPRPAAKAHRNGKHSTAMHRPLRLFRMSRNPLVHRPPARRVKRAAQQPACFPVYGRRSSLVRSAGCKGVHLDRKACRRLDHRHPLLLLDSAPRRKGCPTQCNPPHRQPRETAAAGSTRVLRHSLHRHPAHPLAHRSHHRPPCLRVATSSASPAARLPQICRLPKHPGRPLLDVHRPAPLSDPTVDNGSRSSLALHTWVEVFWERPAFAVQARNVVKAVPAAFHRPTAVHPSHTASAQNVGWVVWDRLLACMQACPSPPSPPPLTVAYRPEVRLQSNVEA